ncbi:competence protein [Peptoniphilus sp. ING2-D1G]|nr:competence protein [Peptoniphilus sp. ING2-D1G]
MDDFFDNQKKILFGILFVILIFVVKVTYDNYTFNNSNKIVSDINLTEDKLKSVDNSDSLNKESQEDIYVHVCGQVKNPGLIKLKADARVIDAVNAAGGMYDDADIDNINLAKKLQDEERVYIPAVGEVNVNTVFSSSSIEQININTADVNELQNLPGIGPKTAEKIIKYRENKSFSKIEDIMNVGGIGEKKFNEIKDYIKTN